MRRLRRTAVAILALVLAATLAACTTTRPEAGADGRIDNGGGLAAPGVTDTTVAVGYQVGDISALRQRLGFTGVDTGSYENLLKGLDAIVAHVNANGGMGGRTLTPIVRKSGGDTTAEGECRGFTQDTPVFAAVIGGVFTNGVRPCYLAARTIMIDLTPIAHDQSELDAYDPFLWAPTQPELGAFVTAQIQSLADRGWFAGSTGTAVVTPDSEVSRRVAAEVVVPQLGTAGVTNTPTYYIDASSIGTLGQTVSQSLQGIRSAGVDRVFVVGGARILGIMAADVLAADLDVRYTISSFDLPSFFVDNPTYVVDGLFDGMAGLGYSRVSDERLSAAPFPDPARPAEVLCKQIVDDAGATPPQQYRENYQTFFSYCDATFMVDAALDRIPVGTPVTPNGFRDAVWSLGTTAPLALPESTEWRPGSFTAASTVRPLEWVPTCTLPGRDFPGCFEYVGDPISLLPGAGDPAAAPSVAPTAVPAPAVAPG